MFKAPKHAYQVILDAGLARSTGGPATEYATDRAQHPGQLASVSATLSGIDGHARR